MSVHVYEVRPRKDKRGVDLISDALPFGGLWYGEPNAISNAIGYAKFFSRSHDAAIRVYDEAGNVIETHEHTGDFKRVFRNFVPPFPYNQVTMKGPPTNETIPQPQRQGAARPFPRTESKKKTTDQNETGTF